MDSRDSNVQQNHPTLCRNGCGFYSNAGNDGLCSVCYKETVKKKQAPPTNMPATLAPTPGSMANLSIDESSGGSCSGVGATNNTPSILHTGSTTVTVVSSGVSGLASPKVDDELEGSSADTSTSGADEDGGSAGKDGKKKKNRCFTCKKKIGLTGFSCRCGGLFCSIHRYSDKHQCGFDYKAMGAEEISKSNPVVVAEKVAKI